MSLVPNLVMADLECAGFLFYSNFDSGNLARVEWVPKNESAVVSVSRNGKEVPEIPDIEFNIWTKPDCMGTEFQNGNRTWFHFGIKGYLPSVLMKINLVDLNRQAKMYSQGMAPVYRTVPGKSHWERIRDKPTYTVEENIFTLSFKFRTPENIDAVMFFAFTYPYTYAELQSSLMLIEERFLSRPSVPSCDDIYYVRECVCKSLENRRIDLITITSYYNITTERETRLVHLFPDLNALRPFKFQNKKVIFVSARVHPGETPSSFVFNGLLNFLLNRDDPLAILVRRLYVFKMVPFLNPDGVVNGHYRTDTRGVNLNRMYLSPTLAEHPSVYAARALIQYYHWGFDKEAAAATATPTAAAAAVDNFTTDNYKMTHQVQVLSLEEKREITKRQSEPWCSTIDSKGSSENCDSSESTDRTEINVHSPRKYLSSEDVCSLERDKKSPEESGLFMYIDMHGHASKKGIFIYGNHFDDVESNVECMLLPKIMSLNNHNFHFTACNFTERNMYLRDRRDGMSREGSGRVAVLKLTGLVRSYTLECNYNSGRMVNVLPPTVKDGNNRMIHTLPLPPKYTPHIFEEVGRALGASILDLTGNNSNSRIPNSEFHTLSGLREWLRVNCQNELGFNNHHRIINNTTANTTTTTTSTMRHKLPNNQSSTKPMRCKSMKTLSTKSRPASVKPPGKKSSVKVCAHPPIPVEKKENMIMFPSRESAHSHSHTQTQSAASVSRIFNKSASKSKGLSLRPRSKRELSRTKSRDAAKPGGSAGGRSKPETENGPKEGPGIPGDRLKLREICFIKENLTKKLIAKFGPECGAEGPGNADDDDDLVVAWDPSYSPKVVSRPQSSASNKYGPFIKSVEASTSKQNPRSGFKGNAGYKSGSFVGVVKPKHAAKGTLRRFTAATIESASKIDKIKKRKKLKSKML